MLRTEGLTVGYGGNAVLEGIEATLVPGELAVLIGANGSGKSTLLRTLCGAQKPLSGEVFIDGRALESVSQAEKSRLMAVVLTDRTGGAGLRVGEVAAIGRHPYSGFFGRMSATDREIVDAALHAVGLWEKRHRFLTEISDGERQKAMIARAMAQDTPVVILDEPTSFLDVASRFEIMATLRRLATEGGKAVLLSSHDTAASLPVCDTVWAVTGRSLKVGTVARLAADGTLDGVFGGLQFDADLVDFRP